MDNTNIYKNSIIIIGPSGVGKSLVSRRLGEVNRLPVINADLLRHCLKDPGELILKKAQVSSKIRELQNELEDNPSCNVYRTKHEIIRLTNEAWTLDRQREMRMLMPLVKNYEEMGFDAEVSKTIKEKYGDIAWHFYQKQFEIKLLEDIIKNLNQPCVIDMGGGMVVSLDEEYKKLDQKFREINQDLYLKHFDLDSIGFDKIQNVLKPFKNIIELELPTDYKKYDTRASRDPLNDTYISTNQYHTLASKSVSVGGLIVEDRLNDRALESVVRVINKHVQSEDLEMN